MAAVGGVWKVQRMPSSRSEPGALPRLVFYAAAVVMALIHVFVTFRGLSSAEGMNQAQLARQIARTGSYQTHVVQPYAWTQMAAAGRQPSPLAMPETLQPPLQPLLWSVLFKPLKLWHVYDPLNGAAIFKLDRVIACLGVVWYLLTIYLTHGAARRLFDGQVAAIAATALLVCQPAWELMVSGAPRAMLLPLFAAAFRLYAAAAARATERRRAWGPLALLGVVCGLLVLTHWMAFWIVLGILVGVVAFLPKGKVGALWVAVFPALVLAGWGWWNAQLCGDPLGAAKSLVQAQSGVVAHELLLRDFTPAMPQLQVDDLFRRVGQSWQAQVGRFPAHVGYGVLALFFFLALMHRFRRSDTAAARWMLAVVFGCVTLGMGLLGLPEHESDPNSLYVVLMPAMGTFGAAMLVVLWSRFQATGELASRWGAPVVVLLLCALPMAVNLPVLMKFGLTMGGRIPPHWPPFFPERIQVLRQMVEKDEYVYSDSPAFVAWYADVPAVNLPIQRADYEKVAAEAAGRGAKLAGFVMTPVSAKVERVTDVFSGTYSEWRDLIMRGPMIAFDKDFMPHADFAYKFVVPIVGSQIGEKESLSLSMVFYTDKARTLRKEPVAKKP